MTDEKTQFCDCIRQCERGMYTLAFSITKNSEDAADVIQDSIVKAYCNLDSLRDYNKFRFWIMTIVHNTAIEFLRKQRPTVDIEEQWDLAQPEPNIDSAAKLTIWEAVQNLKQPYRTVTVLFYYQSCSTRQIAAITSTSEATVRQQLSRARKMLAKLLNKEDFFS